MSLFIKQNPFRIKPPLLWLLPLFLSMGILTAGLMSELYLGDEIHHYRFARDIFTAGERVPVDPLYGRNFSHRNYYEAPPLWHFGLAFLWKITGGVSFPVAQIYHTLFYALLLVFTYFLGKELYGEREGRYAMILIGTIPMVACFGILFYMDVPLAAFSTLTLLLLVKKREFLAGLGFGLACLTKLHGLFFGLPFLVTILLLRKRERWLKRVVIFSLGALLLIGPDLYWRETHLGMEAALGSPRKFLKFILHRGSKVSETTREWLQPERSDPSSPVRIYYNSSFSTMTDHVKYFGIPLLGLLLLLLLRRKVERKDLLIGLPLPFYLLSFLFAYGTRGDIRYLLSLAPLLCVIASKMIPSIRARFLKMGIIALCLLQFLTTLTYTAVQRKIPDGIREGMEYINRTLPEKASVLYIELNLTEFTRQKAVWDTLFWDIRKLLWADDESIKNALKKNQVNFILVKKSRIYDDMNIRHTGGYPTSFVNRLDRFPFLQPVFENSELSLWELREGEKTL